MNESKSSDTSDCEVVVPINSEPEGPKSSFFEPKAPTTLRKVPILEPVPTENATGMESKIIHEGFVFNHNCFYKAETS